ncbi:hypothetical protein [Oceanobacillus caeni]
MSGSNLEKTTLAKLHFWLHNIGLSVMMIAIGLAIAGVSPILLSISKIQ